MCVASGLHHEPDPDDVWEVGRYVPWTCSAGFLCLGPLALCPCTCCRICWGLGVVGTDMRYTGLWWVVVLTMGFVNAVWGNVDSAGSNSALFFMGFDVAEARHRLCMGESLTDSHSVRP